MSVECRYQKQFKSVAVHFIFTELRNYYAEYVENLRMYLQ